MKPDLKSILIYSGGLDSTVLLYDYSKKGIIKMAISFNYGSKHNDREFEHAQRNTKKLGIEHIRIDIQPMMQYFKSTLLKSGEAIPEGHYEDWNMKKTVVPFRNGIMLSIAAGIADSNGLNSIMLASHAGDHRIYLDCSLPFNEAMGQAIFRGTDNQVQLLAPYSNIDKREIGLIGKELGVDFRDSYTCYNGKEIHCGSCGACRERQYALYGFDTTEYEKYYEQETKVEVEKFEARISVKS